MNFGHLAIFDAVARERSISKAGERLMISQPAVSKQLAQLERNIGARLVDRLPRGVRLTAAGEMLAGYARRIFNLAEEAERALGELSGLQRGRLSVAATPTIGVYWLASLLVRFRREHPGIELRMEIHPTATIARLLLHGEIDLGLAESEVAEEEIEARVFQMDRLVAICAANHPLARKRSASLDDLCKEPFVVREVGSGSKSLVERALAARGKTVAAAMSLGSTEAIKRAVMEGVGVAIVSGLAVKLEVQTKRLVVLKVKGLEVERPLYLLRGRMHSGSAAAEAFSRMVVWEGEMTGRGRSSR